MRKKLLLLLLFAVGAAVSAQAQNRHNLEFTFGGPSGGVDIAGLLSSDEFSTKYDLKYLYDDKTYLSSFFVFGAQYSYSLKNWLQVGAEAGWGMLAVNSREGYAYEDDEEEIMLQHHLSLMPTVKLRWHKGVHADLYSRLSAGAYLSTGQYEETSVKPAWEVVPLGLSVGTKRVYIFSEAGIGTSYFLRGGIGFRF